MVDVRVAGNSLTNNSFFSARRRRTTTSTTPSSLLYQGRKHRPQQSQSAAASSTSLVSTIRKWKWTNVIIISILLAQTVIVVVFFFFKYPTLFYPTNDNDDNVDTTININRNRNNWNSNNQGKGAELHEHIRVRGIPVRQQEVDVDPAAVVYKPFNCIQIAPCSSLGDVFHATSTSSTESCKLFFPHRFWNTFPSVRLIGGGKPMTYQNIYEDFVQHRMYVNEEVPSYQQLDCSGFLLFEKEADTDNKQSMCQKLSMPDQLVYYYNFEAGGDTVLSELTTQSSTSIDSAIPFYQHHTSQSYLPEYLNAIGILNIPNTNTTEMNYEWAYDNEKRDLTESFYTSQLQQRMSTNNKNNAVLFTFVRTDIVSRFLDGISTLERRITGTTRNNKSTKGGDNSINEQLTKWSKCFQDETLSSIERVDCVLDIIIITIHSNDILNTTAPPIVEKTLFSDALFLPQSYLMDAWTLYGKHDLGIVLADMTTGIDQLIITGLKNQKTSQTWRRRLDQKDDEEEKDVVDAKNGHETVDPYKQNQLLLKTFEDDDERIPRHVIEKQQERQDYKIKGDIVDTVSTDKLYPSTKIDVTELESNQIWKICRLYAMDLIMFDIIGMKHSTDCPSLKQLLTTTTTSE